MCRKPVGEGAKRVTTGRDVSLALKRAFLFSYCAMQWTSAPNIGEAPLPQRARGYWKARFSAAAEGLEKLLEAERAQLPPWFVVGFGYGIAAWFALRTAPAWQAFLCIAAALALLGFTLGGGRAGRALGWFALAATLGCGLVWARSSWVAETRLSKPAIADVAGRGETVYLLAPNDGVRLLAAPADATLPPHVRVSLDQKDLPAGIA